MNLDHVGFAVHDASSVLRRLHAAGLLLPVAGEEDDEFRYVIGRREAPESGIRVELLDPHGDEHGFLARYLRGHGEGAHHVTFMVDDFDATLGRMCDLGITASQVDAAYPPWREAFIHPKLGLGTLVQVASSIHGYPSGRDADRETDPCRVPHRRSGRNRHWWRAVVSGHDADPPAPVVGVTIGSPNPGLADTVFGELLSGSRHTPASGVTRYSWPSGFVEVAVSEMPTMSLLFVDQMEDRHVQIGDTVLTGQRSGKQE